MHARRGQRVAAVLVVAALAGLVAAVGIRWWQYEGHVLPGVRVAGVHVDGLDEASARGRLDERLGARLNRPVPVSVDGKRVEITPATALRLDAKASAADTL